ncbi:MAG: TrkH family potassium uptake protein [Oscillospiraceae bacterium]|nr:TrkH family potassium uptake protein [Oscillospiraceae bacterium]
MNYRMIAYLSGVIILIEATFMLLPALVALIYGEASGWCFLITILAAGAAGFLLTLLRPKKRDMYAREGFVITALAWIVISLIGAAPFTMSGQIPSYLDAVFEMVSGFTTTGSSVVPNVEVLDRCMNFWRCLSHWLGGMGILVFMLAIVNLGGGQSNHLLRAESPGPTVSKMVPNMRKSAAILYSIYVGMTLLQIMLLLLGGMPLFDSLCHSFATAGTGGFGVKAASIGYYDSYYLQGVIAVFMVLFGVNFNAYYFLLMRKWRNALHITEVRTYFGIIAVSTLLITANITGLLGSVYDALHHAFFAVSSIMTTTGFATVDFNQWPGLSRLILVMLMIVGACAGSTGGGVKVSRMVIVFKTAAFEVRKLLHPASVKVLTVDGKRVSRETIQGVQSYLVVYFAITVISILLVSLDGYDLVTTVTAVEATLNNIGPGLEMVGPAGNYSMFSPLSKIVLTMDMLLGRLELFPLLIMLMPSTWRKH